MSDKKISELIKVSGREVKVTLIPGFYYDHLSKKYVYFDILTPKASLCVALCWTSKFKSVLFSGLAENY